MLNRLHILIIAIITAAVYVVLPLDEVNAASSSQTILNPAKLKKPDYPKIVIYTVSWCPHCRELKEYLTSHNIPFINRDVELEPAAMEQMVEKYKSYGVPVIVLGNDQAILKGFTKDEFEKTVARLRSTGKK